MFIFKVLEGESHFHFNSLREEHDIFSVSASEDSWSPCWFYHRRTIILAENNKSNETTLFTGSGVIPRMTGVHILYEEPQQLYTARMRYRKMTTILT